MPASSAKWPWRSARLALRRPLQCRDRLGQVTQRRVDVESEPERPQGRPRTAQLEVALAHPALGAEMEWVQLQHPLAVPDRPRVFPATEVEDRPLVVYLGEPRGLARQVV